MQDPNLHEVTKKEIHYLPACPCMACVVERERRGMSKSLPPHVTRLSVDAAHLLGFVRHTNPHGSLARQLMHEQ